MLLTISIPTYNRPNFLEKCLDKIILSTAELNENLKSDFQILISDNSDNNLTGELIRSKKYHELSIVYKKNDRNIGSDANIAQCLSAPRSKYVMLLGDDDYITKYALFEILTTISNSDYTIGCVEFFGLYNNEERNPKKKKKKLEVYNNAELFIRRNIKLSFISGLIFNRELYEESIVNKGIGTNLVHFKLALHQMGNTGLPSFYLGNFLVVATRNNTGGYNPLEIFYEKFWKLVEEDMNLGLEDFQIKKIQIAVLNSFYNRSISRFIREQKKGLTTNEILNFDRSFKEYFFYKYLYRRLFKRYSKIGFSILTVSYLIGTMIYYPRNFVQILKHSRYILNK